MRKIKKKSYYRNLGKLHITTVYVRLNMYPYKSYYCIRKFDIYRIFYFKDNLHWRRQKQNIYVITKRLVATGASQS